MVALGVGTLWLGYAVSMWGYCLVRGYDVPFTALFHATWPAGEPPMTMSTPGQVVLPGGHKLGQFLPGAHKTVIYNPGA